MFATIAIAAAAAAQVPAETAVPDDGATIDVVADTEAQPAVMINRGISLAMQGREAEARAVFEKVKTTRVDYTLETRDGRWIYPPDLARAALKSLDRGDFRAATLALRD